MKIVIPYRENSQRCKSKNTREFFNGKSLLQLTMDHLIGEDVYLACIPSDEAVARAKHFGTKRVDLSEMTATGTSSDLVMDIGQKIDPGPVGFVFCTNPVYFLFNDFQGHLSTIKKVVTTGGSAMVVYPFKHYVLDEKMQAINHGQGHWHRYSQHLPQWYINPWFFIATTTSNIAKFGYWHTPDVVPVHAKGPCVDIDTEDDFLVAQKLYSI